ncbi:MAG: hypothetical protein QW304_08495 [Thermoproteota archaeon]
MASKDIVINIKIGWPQVTLFLALIILFFYVIPFIVDSYVYKIGFELNPEVINNPDQDIELTGFVKRGWIFSKYNIQGLDVEIWLKTNKDRILIGWEKTSENGNFSRVFKIPPGSLPKEYTVEVMLVMDENVKATKTLLFVQTGPG